MVNIPLSLYIGVPWCLRKCPYCDFNSYPLPESGKKILEIYVEKLLIDIEIEATKLPGSKLNSIYFGGGTPSLLSIDAVKRIINRIKGFFSFASDIEITLEANPGTVNFELCEGFKDAGINRISLGVQSFADEKLKSIGRIHNAEQAQEAINGIKQAKFSNFNVDIMFGLPRQNVETALYDLQMVLSFAPPHLSWYQLTLEVGTQFATQPPVLPHSEELWEIQQAGQNLLVQSGLLQYEISAYSKPGFECQHNTNYWQYGDYLGVGAGAHSKITFNNHIVKRQQKIANPQEYLQADLFIIDEEIVSLKKRAFEFMLNALRLYRPIKHRLFYERTGITIDVIVNELQHAENLGLLKLQNDTIVTTTKGKNFLNDLLEIFL